MENSIISAIEDLLDEYEDSVYNHEDSYKINKHRGKVMFAINEVLKEDEKAISQLSDDREVEKLYRLSLDEYGTPNTSFYSSKRRALEELENFKDIVKEQCIDNDDIDAGAMILLQTIDLNKSEDLYMCETLKVVSELTVEEDGMLLWKDYEVNSERN